MSRRILRYGKSLVLAHVGNATTITDAPSFNGLLAGVIFGTIPTLDSTNTATLNVKDSDGNVIYTTGAIAQAAKATKFVDSNNQPLVLPLSGATTVEVVTSGSQSADRTFPVVLLIRQEI